MFIIIVFRLGKLFYSMYINLQKVYGVRIKLKFSALLKAYDDKYTENSKKNNVLNEDCHIIPASGCNTS